MSKYIVVWTEDVPEVQGGKMDDYEVFKDGTELQNYEKAMKRYKEVLLIENLYSANLCKIMNSTDH